MGRSHMLGNLFGAFSGKVIDKQGLSGRYKVILHIGPSKTGSSAIQKFLHDNQSVLAEYGVYYPSHHVGANQVSGGHAELFKAICARDMPKAEAMIRQFRRHADKRGQTLLLSSETFVQHHRTFAQFADLLPVGDVAVMGFYREPIDKLLSGYNQTVKRHLQKQRLAAFCRTALESDSAHYTGAVFTDWANRYGEANLYIYPYVSHTTGAERLEFYFLDQLGIAREWHGRFVCNPEAINSGYTRSALELKRLLNVIMTEQDESWDREIDGLLQHYSDHSDEHRPGVVEQIGPELYGELIAKFRSSHEEITGGFLRGRPVEGHFGKDHTLEKQHVGRVGREYSIRYVADKVFADHAALRQDILARLRTQIADAKPDYDRMRLAEAFGLDLGQLQMISNAMGRPQLNRIMQQRLAVPDCLRELSLLLELSGHVAEAYEIASRALKLRPGGALIKKTRDRLKRRMDAAN
jgi:hypothetical protein